MSNRQHYALLRGSEDRLVLHTLYYADEVRPLETASKLTKPLEQEVGFAEQYIEALSKEFDPEQYRDEYRETLGAIIRAKAEGHDVEVAEAPPAPPKTTDLMDALRRSVEQARKPPARAELPAARPPAAVTRLDERKGSVPILVEMRGHNFRHALGPATAEADAIVHRRGQVVDRAPLDVRGGTRALASAQPGAPPRTGSPRGRGSRALPVAP